MASGSKSLRTSVVPVSDEPNQAAAPQQAEVETVVEKNEAVDFATQPRTLRPRKPHAPGGEVGGSRRSARKVGQKKEKFRISLTEEEIREDLYAMTGKIPKPKTNKKSQAAKKDEVRKLFPGSSLEGISVDNYCFKRFYEN